jgi:hypothetical protein
VIAGAVNRIFIWDDHDIPILTDARAIPAYHQPIAVALRCCAAPKLGEEPPEAFLMPET